MNLTRYLLFGCGQLGMMALARFFLGWLVDFAQKGGKSPDGAEAALFSAATVGAVFVGFRLFDGVTDPVAGLVSDAWVRRGRQRRALLWFAFCVPSVGLVLTFAPTLDMSPTLRWVLLSLGMLIFFIGYTFYAIPYWSLIDDYAGGDVQVRRRLSNILGGALLLATGIGFGVSPVMIEKLGFQVSALCFAIPAAILMILPVFAQPPGAPKAAPTGDEVPLLESLAKGFAHRRFVAVLVIFAGSQMSFTVMTSAAPFIAVDLLAGTRGDVTKILAPFLASAILSIGIVPAVARRFGWQKAIVGASIALGLVYTGTAGLGQGIVGSPLMTAGILFGLGGPMSAILLGLEGEAITECANERDGENTSVYFGVFNFVIKGLNGVALFLTGVLANQIEAWGTMAVRSMGLMAGGLLAVGVIAYFLIRPPGSADTPPPE